MITQLKNIQLCFAQICGIPRPLGNQFKPSNLKIICYYNKYALVTKLIKFRRLDICQALLLHFHHFHYIEKRFSFNKNQELFIYFQALGKSNPTVFVAQ